MPDLDLSNAEPEEPAERGGVGGEPDPREEVDNGSDGEALSPAIQNPVSGVWAGASLAGGSGGGSLIDERENTLSAMDEDDTIADELEANGIDSDTFDRSDSRM